MPRSITTRGAAYGGNSLGFDGKEDLVCTCLSSSLCAFQYFFSSFYADIGFTVAGLDITVQWSLSRDDPAINSATERLLREAISYAKSEDLYNEYLYLNYALEKQDPIASYGAESVNFLRRVSGTYDPSGTFQKLVPGGFKLWREDVGCC